VESWKDDGLLARFRVDIVREVARLAERLKIEEARKQTDTSGITRKSTELARDHVTAVILDRFTRESHDLKLERVTLDHPGGRKGQFDATARSTGGQTGSRTSSRAE